MPDLFERGPLGGDEPDDGASSPRSALVAVAGLATGALLLAMSMVAAPYVVQSAGPTIDTLGDVDGVPLIEVEGAATYPTSGSLRLTTVSVRGGPGGTLDAVTMVTGWLDSSSAVVPVEQVYPTGLTREDRDERSAVEMTTSQENATAAALTALGMDVVADVVVADTVPGTGAEGVLESGDVLLAIGGVELVTFQDLADVLAATPPGSVLAVDVRRVGERRALEVVTGDDGEGGSVLGVLVDPAFDFPVDVTIRIEEVGGPSAGTMFALGIVDILTPGALTGGQDIAGTGTISVDGDVGAIGGIRQKLDGAARDGADYFLVPAGNCPEVVGHVPAGLRVVSVSTLAAAIDAVEAIGSGAVEDLPACAVG